MRVTVRFNAQLWGDFSMVVDLEDGTDLDATDEIYDQLDRDEVADALWSAILEGSIDIEPFGRDGNYTIYEAEEVE